MCEARRPKHIRAMKADSMTKRAKVAVEIGIIAGLTISFLLLFPRRNPVLDTGLAGLALVALERPQVAQRELFGQHYEEPQNCTLDRMRKVAALAGTVGPVLFGAVLVILTLIEYDFMRSLGWEPLGLSNTDWPSGLALGPQGYIVTAAFLTNGLFVIFFAVGLLQALPFTRTSRAASALLLLAGVAMMGLASTTDPTIRTTPATLHGHIHDGCFVALGTTLFPSMLLFGWTFRSIPAWRSLSTYTWLTAAAAVPTFALKGAAFYLFLAGVLAWTLIVARKLNNLDERSFPPKPSERN